MPLVLRTLVSVGLLALLLSRVEVGAIVTALGGINGPLLGLACVLFLCGQWINTERWRQLLIIALGTAPSRRYLMGLVFAGMFFNFFLPSTVGGDVARAEMARTRLGGRTDSYLSIVIARLFAFVAVLVIGLIASLVAWRRFGWFDGELALTALVFMLPAAAVFLLTRISVIDRLAHVSWLPTPWLRRISSVARAGRAYTRSGVGVAWVFLLSVFAQVVGNVFVIWALASALGIGAPLSFHLVAVPLITLITLLPVSINGIGVREGGFVHFYSKIGVAGNEAIALSLAYTLVLIIFSVIGGGYLASGRGTRVESG
jgi:uncharacterized protein (TIRG00374 family)